MKRYIQVSTYDTEMSIPSHIYRPNIKKIIYEALRARGYVRKWKIGDNFLTDFFSARFLHRGHLPKMVVFCLFMANEATFYKHIFIHLLQTVYKCDKMKEKITKIYHGRQRCLRRNSLAVWKKFLLRKGENILASAAVCLRTSAIPFRRRFIRAGFWKDDAAYG